MFGLHPRKKRANKAPEPNDDAGAPMTASEPAFDAEHDLWAERSKGHDPIGINRMDVVQRLREDVFHVEEQGEATRNRIAGLHVGESPGLLVQHQRRLGRVGRALLPRQLASSRTSKPKPRKLMPALAVLFRNPARRALRPVVLSFVKFVLTPNPRAQPGRNVSCC
jgi:hypothetical protein